MKKKILIDGMSCEHCVKHVKDALEELKGVSEVKVNLASKNAELEADENITNAQLKYAVEDAGYEVIDIENIF